MGFLSPVTRLFYSIYVFSWDTVLVFGNLVLPNKPAGTVVPDGHPGFGGEWPEYITAKEGDSRCACPALNAMANHGILSHDGRDLSFVELTQKVQATYNLAPTFCVFLSSYVANFMKKDYHKDRFDLKDIDQHNQIEHDGSLIHELHSPRQTIWYPLTYSKLSLSQIGEDIYFEPDTSKIAVPLINELLGSASGKDTDGKPALTYSDLSRALSQRQADCKATNPEFSTNLSLRMHGFGNCAAMLTVFNGNVDDLRPFLLEERLPDGWLPRNVSRFGLTLGAFNNASLRIAAGTKVVPAKPSQVGVRTGD